MHTRIEDKSKQTFHRYVSFEMNLRTELVSGKVWESMDPDFRNSEMIELSARM